MEALTVIAAPGGLGHGVLAVLQDLSALEYLDPFVWLDRPDEDAGRTSAYWIEHGRRRTTTLARAVAEAGPGVSVARLGVLIPAVSDNSRVPLMAKDAPRDYDRVPPMTEDALRDFLDNARNFGRVIRLRLVLSDLEHRIEADELARDGWHNFLIAPEDSALPTVAPIPWNPGDDPVDLARLAIPTLCGVLGLWRDLPVAPFDEADKRGVPKGGGAQCRVVRAFCRRLDTAALEQTLVQAALSDPQARLPLPRDDNGTAVPYAGHQAAEWLRDRADALWQKNKTILEVNRPPRPVPGATPPRQRWRDILKDFWLWFRDHLSPGRQAGAALQAMVERANRHVDSAVHRHILRIEPSADAVLATRAASAQATWAELTERVGTIDRLAQKWSKANAVELSHTPDIQQVWEDYVQIGLSLGDGHTPAGFAPTRVHGASTAAVLRDPALIAPDPASVFTLDPALARRVGVERIEAGDIMTARAVEASLNGLRLGSGLGAMAGEHLSDLRRWQDGWAGSWSATVGGDIVRSIDRAYAHIQRLMGLMSKKPDLVLPQVGDPSLARRNWVFVILGGAVLAGAAVLAWLTAQDKIPDAWGWPIVCGLAVAWLLVWVVGVFIPFFRFHRDFYAQLRRRLELPPEPPDLDDLLRRALLDHVLLLSTYGQYRHWTTALGSFLHSTVATSATGAASTATEVVGLPEAVRLASARVDARRVAEAAAHLKARIFRTGWLIGPWEAFLGEAAERIGPDAIDIKANPSQLYADRAVDDDSALVRWTADLIAHPPAVAARAEQLRHDLIDALIEDERLSSNTDRRPLLDGLLAEVDVVSRPGVPQEPVQQFLNAWREEAAQPGQLYLGKDLLEPSFQRYARLDDPDADWADGAPEGGPVAPDWRSKAEWPGWLAETPNGLGRAATLVQWSEAFAPSVTRLAAGDRWGGRP
jgi:hypothetical protein